jgi:hypothetical protein
MSCPEHSMKSRGLLNFRDAIVQANVEDGLVQHAVQNGKIGRFCEGVSPVRRSAADKLKLLGNLPQAGIFKQLRQEVLGEHS